MNHGIASDGKLFGALGAEMRRDGGQDGETGLGGVDLLRECFRLLALLLLVGLLLGWFAELVNDHLLTLVNVLDLGLDLIQRVVEFAELGFGQRIQLVERDVD